ncbi:TPA: hypothetical protein ACPIBI_004743 [Pseudomonas aeruginosa]|uniref:hypothetical protein n=1 Tax=Pseudomonas citronellolis TaxID=53408 RepID=UPI001A24EB00|nr:hypothetical protein [Pseudomonas citronellolis]MBH3547426.1 hypothetical protein [Pseudomonas aeruginosa]UUC47453.1 hypothetical protein NOX82_16160 [Pseudomonas citronellolis]HBN9703312.1 hypothetical protein [Pseudomonas aeruginosa]HBN9721860.1 hypothetical protein [Pseudomonas aeruginosa]HBN9767939.1 hypothetical protein [Pseudomonas aeruginosa]
MKWRNGSGLKPVPALKRILVGYLGLYPTLLVVLSVLAPFTRHLSFPLMVLVEVLVLVPITQLFSFPLAGWLVARVRRPQP